MRIWFNQWFGTSKDIIELIKKEQYNGENAIIYSTNKNKYSPIQFVSDIWKYEKEDFDSSDDYIKWCLDFCKNNKIDVFFPYKNMKLISKFKQLFTNHNIKVIVEDYENMKIFDNKCNTYNLLKNTQFDNLVPDFFEITNYSEYLNAMNILEKKYDKICFKLNEDVGGRSYHLITKENPNSIYAQTNSKISREDTDSLMKNYDFKDSIILMPYLNGLEISVDCLSTNQGNIVLPRIKYGRMEQMLFDEEIEELSNKLLDIFNIVYPCNIQYRYHNDHLYLLEINMRMSGGTALSCLASNINIPAIAIKKEFNESFDFNVNKNNHYLSLIKNPTIFESFKVFD